MEKRRESFCGDTLNTFARENSENHWSKVYKKYSSLPTEERNANIVWTSGIVRAGCVPEVFDTKDLVIWCTDNFEKDQRIIKMNGRSSISLGPPTFNQMLKLSKPTAIFKVEEAKNFIKAKNGGRDIFPQCLEDPSTMSKDLSLIQVSHLKKPYKEIAWFLARILGLESTAAIPRLALYILYYSVQGKRVFDWSRIISTEITSQLSNFKKDKKFYMSGYLVFAIIDSHEFQGLHLSKQVDLMTDPVYTWYLNLWKQREMYHFYEVYNSFLSSFKKLMFGESTSRLSLEATSFLNQRGVVEYNEDYNIIRIYCSHVAPTYLPFYVSDKMFIIEVCRQYRFWVNFFAQRKKKQFIQLPWKVGEIMVKNASKIDEFVHSI
jgi:hypothetical protein